MSLIGIGQSAPCTAYNAAGTCQSYDYASSVDVADAEYGPSQVNVMAPLASIGVSDPAVIAQVQQYSSIPPGYTGPSVLGPGTTPPNPPAGYQWTTVSDANGNPIAQVMGVGGSASTVVAGAVAATTDYSSLLWLGAAAVAAYFMFKGGGQ